MYHIETPFEGTIQSIVAARAAVSTKSDALCEILKDISPSFSIIEALNDSLISSLLISGSPDSSPPILFVKASSISWLFSSSTDFFHYITKLRFNGSMLQGIQLVSIVIQLPK